MTPNPSTRGDFGLPATPPSGAPVAYHLAEATLDAFEPIETKDALVLVAFPTTGAASSIAAQYLVRQLSLPLVGHLRMPELHSIVAIQDGRVTSPIRIFGGEVECRLDKKCPRIYLVTSELPASPGVVAATSELVLEMAHKGGAHLVLALEAVVRGDGDDTPDVFAASASPEVLKELAAKGVPPMERALIGGVAGPIMLGAALRGGRAGALLVEATRDHPDGRAAAALIKALEGILPTVAMDAKPLLEEAMRLEAELRETVNATNTPSNPGNSFI